MSSCFFFPAVLYYDYLLALPLEIQFLWSPGNQGWLTLAILLNRYLPVFGHIPLAVSCFTGQQDITVRLSSFESSCRYLLNPDPLQL